MRQCSVLVILAAALGGACGKSASPCEATAAKLVAMPPSAGLFDPLRAANPEPWRSRIRVLAVEACKADTWSPKAQRCITEATDPVVLDSCYSYQLDADQRGHFQSQLRRLRDELAPEPATAP